MLKAGGEVLVEWLIGIFNVMWKIGVSPKDWRRAIISIFKRAAEGYVGTIEGCILSVLGNIFGKILNERMRGKTEGMIMEETRQRLCRNMFVLCYSSW